ncbi:hypothetical protein CHGG_03040 [Chaetomium globosum CBS 148.51]|uniref:phenylalanine--tRNA ligase n=1 Tax=Chaetomium globosum (strain ATCC 6205 / CBS 148.51 / DSM 1962 / NBRC 6347 / NRRL 1970) TaxID=306901 RepID=Q2H9R4_CHAGB|nr:uncharacterized protein CHGG_03040 [Chaetomium globosum CBS 148.51]EAQ91105.1 hypothetical protein CHGG_03040 [Chaetomium globosum CBS 148.51]
MAPTSSNSTEDLPSEVLQALSKSDLISSTEAFPDVPFKSIKAALDRLASRSMVTYEQVEREEAFLEPEAEIIVSHGSHEARVFEAVRQAVDGLSIQDLESKIGDKTVTKLGQGKAFKEKWIKKDGAKLIALVESIDDVTRNQLKVIQEKRTHDAKIVADLKKRKLLNMQKVISFRISKGPKFALELVKEETDLTAEMLASGSWKTAAFKPYNFKALGADQHAGALHPLNKVRQEFRQIFFEMGFTEMPTNRFVESGFWNFDALFVPQQHPARDLQDTFYVSDPVRAGRPGPASAEDKADYEAYFHNVKAIHQDGKFGSIGYRYPWSEDESLRNETLDATHLCEFHHVEGVIADYGLTLGGLMEFMDMFFGAMGVTDLRYKPAYNPYTEPSMEIFSYHKGLNKLIEIGNSGIFRPEMLEAMGLPKDMRVFGFGLSLERPTMIKYGMSNIRELLGHSVDLNFIQRNPAPYRDTEPSPLPRAPKTIGTFLKFYTWTR